jgi:hypothetical protein
MADTTLGVWTGSASQPRLEVVAERDLGERVVRARGGKA